MRERLWYTLFCSRVFPEALQNTPDHIHMFVNGSGRRYLYSFRAVVFRLASLSCLSYLADHPVRVVEFKKHPALLFLGSTHHDYLLLFLSSISYYNIVSDCKRGTGYFFHLYNATDNKV